MRTRALIEESLLERDDISSLPLPRAAKAYARRKGMKALNRQPEDFLRVNHQLMNPTRSSRKFTNRDEAGRVKKSMK